ncbi:MAG TPA: S53 family peptidase [Solirubrobacteraceae bacterium]|nr:S53 family peptidase [Solirubrobacteraceae bacterium]
MRERFRGPLAAGAVAAASLALASGASAATSKTTLNSTVAPAATAAPTVGAVPGGARVSFQVNLPPTDPAGAAALARAVSDPSSSSYREYLTPAQWEARFSPSGATVAIVEKYLRSQGFKVSGVSADRMTIQASGSAAQVASAFGTTLSYHRLNGKKLIVNNTALTVPTSVAHLISGVSGLPEVPATPNTVTDGAKRTAAAGPSAKPPAGFRNARPCGAYYGQILAASFPPLPGGYPADAPYAPCGYTPPQLRGAYSLPSGDQGSGVTVAVVDAYASPTLFSDAHTYAANNDPSNPLTQSQFSELLAKNFNHGPVCGGQNGWWGEQTLDVEAVHAMAPAAHILYAGAQNCENPLYNMDQKIIDGHLADVITNSWAATGGDLLITPSARAAFDNVLQMAAATGVTVMYSSGDDGDNYDVLGAAVPDYPASSPWATAVGGTTLAIGSANQRLSEYGWSTGRALFCNSDLHALGGCKKSQLGTWLPLSYDYGGGGGTSYSYLEPYYQAGVVPTSLSEIRSSTAMRVLPDIALDADPTTGMLVGETQTFPDGVYYDQYRIGGTSLASPLLAGVVADADQAAGGALGFINPRLYALSGNASAIDDIVSPPSPTDIIRPDYFNGVDASAGIEYSARTVDDQGTETYCTTTQKGKQKCTSAPISLETSPGYDNMTGLGSPGTGFVTALAGKR